VLPLSGARYFVIARLAIDLQYREFHTLATSARQSLEDRIRIASSTLETLDGSSQELRRGAAHCHSGTEPLAERALESVERTNHRFSEVKAKWESLGELIPASEEKALRDDWDSIVALVTDAQTKAAAARDSLENCFASIGLPTMSP
jgi:hypothetical protein